jgi:iron(III) transport system ATP-binding protein
MALPTIEFRNVNKTFSQRNIPAVRDLSLSIAPGTLAVVLGPSGSGKTTLLRLLAGFERPDSGEIFVNGQCIVSRQEWVSPEKRGIGMVFQDYALFPHLTVGQNITFGLKDLPASEQEKRLHKMLRLINLPNIAQAYPHELSGGQQQRVAMARALAPHPKVLLMDEPFSNIDPDLRQHMRDEVKRILKSTHTTALLVTHDQREAIELADYIAIINEGRLEQWGTPQDIYCRPVTVFIANFVGRSMLLPGVVRENGVQTQVGIAPIHSENAVGAQVKVMIRPEMVQLQTELNSSALPVRVMQARYWGGEYHYVVQLLHPKADEDLLLQATHPAATPLQEGQMVYMQVNLQEARVFNA